MILVDKVSNSEHDLEFHLLKSEFAHFWTCFNCWRWDGYVSVQALMQAALSSTSATNSDTAEANLNMKKYTNPKLSKARFGAFQKSWTSVNRKGHCENRHGTVAASANSEFQHVWTCQISIVCTTNLTNWDAPYLPDSSLVGSPGCCQCVSEP